MIRCVYRSEEGNKLCYSKHYSEKDVDFISRSVGQLVSAISKAVMFFVLGQCFVFFIAPDFLIERCVVFVDFLKTYLTGQS